MGYPGEKAAPHLTRTTEGCRRREEALRDHPADIPDKQDYWYS